MKHLRGLSLIEPLAVCGHSISQQSLLQGRSWGGGGGTRSLVVTGGCCQGFGVGRNTPRLLHVDVKQNSPPPVAVFVACSHYSLLIGMS